MQQQLKDLPNDVASWSASWLLLLGRPMNGRQEQQQVDTKVTNILQQSHAKMNWNIVYGANVQQLSDKVKSMLLRHMNLAHYRWQTLSGKQPAPSCTIA